MRSEELDKLIRAIAEELDSETPEDSAAVAMNREVGEGDEKDHD